MKMNTKPPKTYGTQQGSPERKVHSNTGLTNEIGKSQLYNLMLHLEEREEE